MNDLIDPKEHKDFKNFAFALRTLKNQYLLRNDILLEFDAFCRKHKKPPSFRRNSSTANFFKKVPELLVTKDSFLIVFRYAIAKYRFFRLGMDAGYMEPLSVEDYLAAKDLTVGKNMETGAGLQIDFLPFYDYFPEIRDSKTLGNGIRFLNKHLSSSLFQNPEIWTQKLFEFIKLHKLNGQPLLINGDILSRTEAFLTEMKKVIRQLKPLDPNTPYAKLKPGLKKRGFEAGWGADAGRMLDTLQRLNDLFNEPDDVLLEEFISRIPMIHKVAVISPHGWFGQENVLGRPDTGGQVIYILDQVRALENHLAEVHKLAGVKTNPMILIVTRLIPEADGTACDQSMEKVFKTRNCWIARVPFKDSEEKIVRNWISRFKIWPYLDRFTRDAQTRLLSEFQGRPDLILGNYSDGNLVAALLSSRLNVIQCSIAHALEKTKYLFSDLYWERMEKDYHFSLQFTADLIAMNKSDFIMTSTYQEIAGTETEIGQYESYQFFTLPDLYHVVNGVHLFSPRFNVVPPGVDETNYFPFHQTAARVPDKTRHWEDRLYSSTDDDIFGFLKDPEKPPIFTMSRLDRIKNLTGLVEAFGQSETLRKNCNLILSGGTTCLKKSADVEEQDVIRKIRSLVSKYKIDGSIRWLPSINKPDTGEVYRIIADRRGVFVQPALFEAFGLTVLEAMASGLPTFATRFGGPSEIIEDGKSGFLINTSRPPLIAEVIEQFIENCKTDEHLWRNISKDGIKRVQERFTWKIHCQRLLSLTKLYGFWRYSVSGQARIKMDRYTDMMYHLLFKERAEKIL